MHTGLNRWGHVLHIVCDAAHEADDDEVALGALQGVHGANQDALRTCKGLGFRVLGFRV